MPPINAALGMACFLDAGESRRVCWFAVLAHFPVFPALVLGPVLGGMVPLRCFVAFLGWESYYSPGFGYRVAPCGPGQRWTLIGGVLEIQFPGVDRIHNPIHASFKFFMGYSDPEQILQDPLFHLPPPDVLLVLPVCIQNEYEALADLRFMFLESNLAQMAL